MSERKTIYDQLCKVLTDFETNDFNGDADACNALYEMLVMIQNRWEDVITAQSCEC